MPEKFVDLIAMEGGAATTVFFAIFSGVAYHAAMRTLTAKIPSALADHVAAEARSCGISESAVLRRVLTDRYAKRKPSKRPKTVGQAVKEIIGSIHGGPKNLATNPKYFEGFGK